ncbi:DUF4190 domain-containing protein [Terrabacter sp. 2RAF25]|uniref:DUF4190 domain-containing protein n=1 Tax=Terrabacter sp. 2RAF25 TaxID=3232998 RepID=UPI003F9D3413
MTAELPPPSGPPQPNPDVDAPPVRATDPTAPTTAPAPAAAPPAMSSVWSTPGPSATPSTPSTPSAYTSSPASPLFPPPPGPGVPVPDAPAYQPTPMPGTNGLAIAALCCGIIGIFPIAAVVAIVLGAVALNQLKQRIQRGRGMAVAGIVLGVLWLLGWVALVVIGVLTDEPTRNPAGAVTRTSDAYVEDLKAGDCFSGAGRTEVDNVTIRPCASPHESQVVTIIAMPAGPYPGEDKVVAAAEKGCTDKADPLITDRAYDELRPSFIYPQDAFSWRGNREIICLVDAPKGTTTGSALK